MWSPKRKVPWDFPSASSWDVDGLFPAAVLQWGEDAAGELQVMMPKAAQSRELWSKPPEAEMRSSPGGNVHKEEPWLSLSQALQGKGQHPSAVSPGREDFWQGGDTLPGSTMEPVSSLLSPAVM